jgi:hypothetical protein
MRPYWAAQFRQTFLSVNEDVAGGDKEPDITHANNKTGSYALLKTQSGLF